MPIYEYKCEKCGYVEEFLEKSRNAVKHNCPECKNVEMKKKISTFACKDSSSQASDACPTGTCPFS
ncbi:MAG: hypothetical protein JXD22_10125 [Sedimentisphaerales bacterium]|nr:hypothetical protein [Sedimentisphaerales bacterium]